jgi:hypothetical protein
MDNHRAADALTDAALDRELESALAVDPSTEFVTRVRTRVQTERDVSWSPWQWGFAAAVAAIIVVVALVVGTSRPNRSQVARKAPVAQPPVQGVGEPRRSSPDQSASGGGNPSSARPEPFDSPLILSPSKDEQSAQDRPVQGRAPGPGFSPAPRTTPRNAVAPATRRNAPRNEPELLISAGEARALRRLFADVRNGLIDLSSLQEGEPATAALQPPSDIAFPPITFEPIASETAEEGERQ